MIEHAMITGSSRGLGLALAQQLCNEGTQVRGCARGTPPWMHSNYQHGELDFAQLDSIAEGVEHLLDGASKLDLLVLNAGVLGEIQALADTPLDEVKRIMDINVWANKQLLDKVFTMALQVRTVVLISSGAAVRGSKGWGTYAISKAALNMLAQLYAAEQEDTYFISVAPGLINTQMQTYLCDPKQVDEEKFPSMQRLREAHGTADMPSAAEVAKQLLVALPQVQVSIPSGGFVDLRTLT